MVKKAALAAVITALALSSLPANAALKKQNLTFSATPCGPACAYWVNPEYAPDPTTADPTTADPLDLVDVVIPPEDAPCTNPSPEGSYDDVVVRAPLKASLLRFEAWPEVDWDIFICQKTKKGMKHLATGANTIDEESITSEEDLCAIGIGCYERADAAVKGGKRYILRAYNWSDPSDLRARVTFFK